MIQYSKRISEGLGKKFLCFSRFFPLKIWYFEILSKTFSQGFSMEPFHFPGFSQVLNDDGLLEHLTKKRKKTILQKKKKKKKPEIRVNS